MRKSYGVILWEYEGDGFRGMRGMVTALSTFVCFLLSRVWMDHNGEVGGKVGERIII